MNEKQKCFLSAVAYVHNDENSAGVFFKKIYNVLKNNFEHFEIICVDDASSDRSGEIIKEAAAGLTGTTVNLLHMSYYQGIELSMNAGTDLAIGDYVLEFDTVEMDYVPSLIMDIYMESLKGYDVVSASPAKRQKFTSAFFYKVFNMGAAGSYKMKTESFRILSRRVINRVSSMNKTVPYRKAVYAASGLPIKNIQYECEGERLKGRDKLEDAYRKNLAADSLILFTNLGYIFSIRMTLVMMVIALMMGIYAIVFYLCGNSIEGWTTTILFMAFAFFGLFGILTIIVKYLSVIVNLVFKRQQYMVDRIEKITK